jgi:hypothetical protein
MKTPYVYRVGLNDKAEITEDGNFIVYYRGVKMEINSRIMEFRDKNMLSEEDVYSVLSGTKGIYLIKDGKDQESA